MERQLPERRLPGDVSAEMTNLERALERGVIDEETYDREMDALIKYANERGR